MIVHVSDPAIAVLRGLAREDGNPWVITGAKLGEALSDVYGQWHRIRCRARIKDVRLHNLRHSFASHAVLQGIPLPVVSRLLGHKRPSMTLRYAHVGDRETEAAAERIGAVIARALDGSAAGSSD